MNTPSKPAALPLARLLQHTAEAVQAVRSGHSLSDALARVGADARPGTQALSFLVLRWLGSAQVVRALLVPKTPAPPIDALLITSLALLWPGAGAPYAPHTLVDQAVAAAQRRFKSSAGFVNAVLRRFLREADALVAEAMNDPVGRYNHPGWWIDAVRADWPGQWQALLEADQQHPPMTLRVNARHGSVEAYLRRLADAGMAAQAIGAQTVVLAQPCPVQRLPGFDRGDVSVQDAAAQRAAPLLLGHLLGLEGGAGARLPAGARVLDACAAPGGKTAHLLELADLDVLALDSDAARLAKVSESLGRLGLAARCVAADAADPAAWWDGQPFAAILLDAPCSASGIVRRHPDVRWLRRSTDIAALARTQAHLLDALWPTLARGGQLLYCTCSIFRAEGQDQIDAFLQRRPDATLAPRPASPGHLLPLPDNPGNVSAHGFGAAADGFFYALLHKN